MLRANEPVTTTPVVVQEEETPGSPYQSAWNSSSLVTVTVIVTVNIRGLKNPATKIFV